MTQNEVSQLYIAIFGRASEGQGNKYWQGFSALDAAKAMLDLDVSKAYLGENLLTDRKFIETIYKNTLDKTYAQDKAGIDYWVDKLSSGVSKAEVVVSLLNAATLKENAGADQEIFNNKVEVSDQASAIMDELGTTKAEYIGILKSILSVVTSDKPSISVAIANLLAFIHRGDVPTPPLVDNTPSQDDIEPIPTTELVSDDPDVITSFDISDDYVDPAITNYEADDIYATSYIDPEEKNSDITYNYKDQPGATFSEIHYRPLGGDEHLTVNINSNDLTIMMFYDSRVLNDTVAEEMKNIYESLDLKININSERTNIELMTFDTVVNTNTTLDLSKTIVTNDNDYNESEINLTSGKYTIKTGQIDKGYIYIHSPTVSRGKEVDRDEHIIDVSASGISKANDTQYVRISGFALGDKIKFSNTQVNINSEIKEAIYSVAGESIESDEELDEESIESDEELDEESIESGEEVAEHTLLEAITLALGKERIEANTITMLKYQNMDDINDYDEEYGGFYLIYNQEAKNASDVLSTDKGDIIVRINGVLSSEFALSSDEQGNVSLASIPT